MITTFLAAFAIIILAVEVYIGYRYQKATKEGLLDMATRTDVTLKQLLGVLTSLENVSTAVKLALDGQSIVLGRAIDHLNDMAEGISIEIADDMFDEKEDIRKHNIEAFIQSLEYCKDKFATSPFEKRALIGAINRIRKQYGK